MNLKTFLKQPFRKTPIKPSRILGKPKKTKKWWGRRLQFVIHQSLRGLLRLKDTPYRIAMGCACGLFCSTLPVLGQTFLGILLARLFRANTLASVPWSWISNPLTTLPIWYAGYRLGIWLLSKQDQALNYAELTKLTQALEKMPWAEKLDLFSTTLLNTLQPLWLGTLVMGLLIAILGFWLAYGVIVRVQRKQEQKRHG